ncbi:MAG: hypothetical protein ACREAE_08845, partial [Nitrosopumilaceae archaeon]
YLIPQYPISRILEINSLTDPQNNNIKQFFDSIEFDAKTKCLLWYDLTNLLIQSLNPNAYKFLDAISLLSNELKDTNLSEFFIEYSDFKRILLQKIKVNENQSPDFVNVFQDPDIISSIDNLEKKISNNDTSFKKIIMLELNYMKTLGNTGSTFDAYQMFVEKRIEQFAKTLYSNIENEKIAEFVTANQLGTDSLTAKNSLLAWVYFEKAIEIYSSFTDEVAEEMESYIKKSGLPYTLDVIEDNLSLNHGVSCCLFISELLTSGGKPTDDDIETLKNIVEDFMVWESDPIKSQYYHMAKELHDTILSDLDKTNPDNLQN